MSSSGGRALPALIVTVTLGLGILIGTVVSHGVRAGRDLPVGADATPLPMPSPVELSNSFSQIADKVEDAVVNINTETTVRIGRRDPHSPDDSPFDDFFDHYFHGAPGGRREGKVISASKAWARG